MTETPKVPIVPCTSCGHPNLRPDQFDEETYHRWQLVETHGDIEAAREAERWREVAELKKRAEVNRKILDALRTAKGEADASQIDESEYLQRLGESMRGWPDVYLELALNIYQERHRIRLRPQFDVIEGG